MPALIPPVSLVRKQKLGKGKASAQVGDRVSICCSIIKLQSLSSPQDPVAPHIEGYFTDFPVTLFVA